uniref:Uncharacterized protein n=1 Tax=Pararge aegeria TaxID=116150 RepID=S4PWW2_9NEOP
MLVGHLPNHCSCRQINIDLLVGNHYSIICVYISPQIFSSYANPIGSLSLASVSQRRMITLGPINLSIYH